MRFLKNLVLALVAVVVVFAVVGVLLPRSVHIERSVDVEARPVTVFTLVNGFARFNDWSPWADIDPEGTRYTFTGPEIGAGARMTWASDNPRVGVGSQEIVASEPHRRVDTVLDFGPQGTAEASFRIDPTNGGTRVTWSFETDFGWNLVGRYLGFFMFDAALGGDYERGLENLKALAESLPDADWSDLEVEIVTTEARPAAFAAGTSPLELDRINEAVESAFASVGRYLRRAGLEPAGPPMVITRAGTAGTYEFEAGIPYSGEPRRPPRPSENVTLGSTPATAAVTAVHVGPPATLPETYAKLEAWAATRGKVLGSGAWEAVVDAADQENNADRRIQVFIPLE